jgi:hypothetical protein
MEAPVTQAPAPVAAPAKILSEAPKAAPAEGHKLTKEFSQMISAEKEKIATEKAKVMAHLSSQQPTMTTPPPSLPEANPQLSTPPAGAAMESELPPSLAGAPSIVSPMAQDFIASPMGSLTPGPAAQASAESKAVLDRLTAMEETNTKLIGQLHAEYAQKVADYDVQNKALQEQVRTLNAKLSGMESEMSKLVQALNNKQAAPMASEGPGPMAENTVTLPGSPSAAPVPMPSSTQGGYRSNFTVQAIIPGRAWLRTESGETITVAEGDMLKSVGRVTKIDPYDGTILIDTGIKVITLTYGTGDYT